MQLSVCEQRILMRSRDYQAGCLTTGVPVVRDRDKSVESVTDKAFISTDDQTHIHINTAANNSISVFCFFGHGE